MPMRDYTKDKGELWLFKQLSNNVHFNQYVSFSADIKRFLTDFYTDLPDNSGKAFKYSKQLVRCKFQF